MKISKIMYALLMAVGVSDMSAQTHFVHGAGKIAADVHNIYVNAEKKSNAKEFRFRTVNEALMCAQANNGKDTLWTNIYIEPSVYWIDNPDDDEVRRPLPGDYAPFGMKLKLDKVRLIGMGAKADDVVLAVNRGQTQGADGNYTMFHFEGSDIEAEGITFGNYCNVDLVYEKNPSMNRSRRKEAIVQAQIAICHGDRYKLTNCRFISRLNLCPFVGAPHTDFVNCYFECTDDALCGTGTYWNCRFTFFSSKPFYTTSGRGATLYDCDIHCLTKGTQYFNKVSGPVQVHRCRFTSEDPQLKIEWTKRPSPNDYCVMTECTLNGRPLEVPTPTEPLARMVPALPIAVQSEVREGQWTMDCYKPADTRDYDWTVDNSKSAWGYAEGVDGAEGEWGLVQIQKGARLMLTADKNVEPTDRQMCRVELCPCKSGGQGFGSATGQYMDICIKFDTRSLTGYGLRFRRSPEYDHAVEVLLVEYANGDIQEITKAERCDLYKKGCVVTLNADGNILTATIERTADGKTETQRLETEMEHVNGFAGFHLQHTGSTGASATVIKSIYIKP